MRYTNPHTHSLSLTQGQEVMGFGDAEASAGLHANNLHLAEKR